MAGWEYCELVAGDEGVVVTFSPYAARSLLFWCGDGSPISAVQDQGVDPMRIAVDTAQGPLMAALDFLGGLGWELVDVLDREPLVMYFKRTRQSS